MPKYRHQTCVLLRILLEDYFHFITSFHHLSSVMKGIVVLGVVLCFSLINAGKMDLADRIIRVIRKCNRTNHLKFQDIQAALRHGQLPTSDEGKCFVACTLEEFGLIKDNVFNREGSYALNELRFSNPAALNKANEITKKCDQEVSRAFDNVCDLGIAIATCGLQNSRKEGIISADLW